MRSRVLCFFIAAVPYRTESVRNRPTKRSGLTFITAAIALWNTVYLQKALRKLADHNLPMPEDRIAHLSDGSISS